MEFLLIVINIVASFHAYTYARWLRQNGNNLGAAGVFLIIAVSLGLPVYRLVTGP